MNKRETEAKTKGHETTKGGSGEAVVINKAKWVKERRFEEAYDSFRWAKRTGSTMTSENRKPRKNNTRAKERGCEYMCCGVAVACDGFLR